MDNTHSYSPITGRASKALDQNHLSSNGTTNKKTVDERRIVGKPHDAPTMNAIYCLSPEQQEHKIRSVLMAMEEMSLMDPELRKLFSGR